MVSKDDIRQDVWRRMTEAGVARFPWARGRIPNFEGAGQAQEQLASLEVWMDATTIKCSPDMPQRPLRRRALEEGKVVYMAVPRLTSAQCFLELDPSRFGDYVKASSIKGAFQVGRPVHPRDMRPIDLIVCGAVAVATGGARLGKGGAFSDLKYALARTLGLVNEDTPILTTVHPIQVLDDTIPTDPPRHPPGLRGHQRGRDPLRRCLLQAQGHLLGRSGLQAGGGAYSQRDGTGMAGVTIEQRGRASAPAPLCSIPPSPLAGSLG